MQDMQFMRPDSERLTADDIEPMTAQIAQTGQIEIPAPVALSNREMQIVHMIGVGKKVGTIAVELGLSVKTVSTYRIRALHKLRLLTNVDLVNYVTQTPLTTASDCAGGDSNEIASLIVDPQLTQPVS